MAQQVIIGGGPAATNAVEAIRQFDGDSQISLICDEPAHSRMALPYWLSGQISREHTYTADAGYFERLGVDAKIGARVAAIHPQTKTVDLADGTQLSYDNLLLATGSRPLPLPIEGGELPEVTPQWSLSDIERSLAILAEKSNPRVVLVGAGFIGFIVLSALFKRGCQLTVVERAAQVLPRMLAAPAAQLVQRWLQEKGIGLHAASSVAAITRADDGTKRVELSSGETLSADLVVAAVGVSPNLDLVEGTEIETDHGILVNERMQTSVPSIYAAGDCAQGSALFQHERQVHAIQPTAVDHGRVAGANMAGQDIAYPGSLSMNVLDVCGLQCVSYGNWDDSSAEQMEISNESTYVYRNLLWTGDKITGAMFLGRANDVGMLTDVGMVKGLMQTQSSLGPWKEFLGRNPFDIRRAFIGSRVAEKLAQSTLLGRPATTRAFHVADTAPTTGPHHRAYVGTKPS